MVCMLTEFGTLNTVVLTTYLAAMVWIGIVLAGRQKTSDDYFLAGRNMPWLAVGMSMFASLTSATTFMGVPAFAYTHNMAMIFGVAMSLVAAPILARLFYPFYRKHRVTTSYEYILMRFGPGARYAVSALFVLGRLGWLGIVIYAPAKAMNVASGMSLYLAIGLMGFLAVFYTVLGGLSAVIWTDVVQFVILVGGAIWLAVSLVDQVPGGAGQIIEAARQAQKFDVFDWQDMSRLTAFSAMIGWFFVFLNDYGTDQVTVQRLMAVRTDKGVTWAIVFNAVNDLLINGLLIFIGLGLFAYFAAFPERLGEDAGKDGILPFYIMHSLPPGVSGLMITAIFAAAMSSVDSGINSLSTVLINDYVRPLKRHPIDAHGEMTLARVLTVALGVFSVLAAVFAASIGNIVQMWMGIVGLFAAPVLSIFVLGMLTRTARFSGWLLGALCSIGLILFIQYDHADQIMEVWYFPLSFAVTTCLGYVASRIINEFMN
ncbi:MAG: sodium/solute symporter [Phycisphaerae bacterium]|nr:sodium/solute symporter [Phycisphaerae bacterium]